MMFNSVAEILRFYAAVRDIGPAGAVGLCAEDDEDQDVKNLVYTGRSDPKAWANVVHEKVDIENALNRIFPGKRNWIQDVLITWAVDGYEDGVTALNNTSPFHKQRVHRTHRRDLAYFIGEITDELVRIGYLKKDINAYNDFALTSFAVLNK